MQPRAVTEPHDGACNLIHRVFLNFFATLQAVGAADAGKEQAEIIVDLSGGADSRTRIAGGVLLSNGYGRCDSVDDVGIGLLNSLQELAGVGGKRFHIATLALRINRVESERRLARSRHPGDNRQGVVRDLKIYVFEVMDARTANNNSFRGHQ